jgi:hypothetical protein
MEPVVVLLLLRVRAVCEAQLWKFTEPQDPYDTDKEPEKEMVTLFRSTNPLNTCGTNTAISTSLRRSRLGSLRWSEVRRWTSLGRPVSPD